MIYRKRMMLVFFKFLTILLGFSSTFVYAERIKVININGLDTISRGTVLNYLPVEVGDDPSKADLNVAAKSLLDTNFFSEVSIKYINDNLNITVSENPTIKFFEVINFKEDEVLSEKTIDEIKDNFNLNVGKVFVNSELNNLLDQLGNLYRYNGFYDFKIAPILKTDINNRIGITLDINEGERALIKSFSIKGSKHFNEATLLDEFEIGEPDFYLLNLITEKDKFSIQKFEAGISQVNTKYQNSGFLDFAILDKSIMYQPEDKSLIISLNVREGNRYKIGSIVFPDSISTEIKQKLRQFIELSDHEFLDRKKLLRGIESIAKYFQNQGFAFSVVESKVTKATKMGELTISILIDESVLTYIDRIVISGNNKTQDDVIRRQMKLLEGQIYSKKDLDESINKIKRLGYFSDVKYSLVPSLDKTKADLKIEVTETKTGEISVGLSHSNSTGAAITAGISQNNILGTGNILNANYSNSSAVKEISFYFKDPFFNDHNHSISYGYFDKQIDAANLDASNYSISESGFVAGYGIPLGEFSNIFVENRTSTIDLTCGSDLSNIYEINQCGSNDDFDSKLKFSYIENSLNDFYFPTDGSKTNMTFTFSLPGISDFKYYQIESAYRLYNPIFDDKTFKFSTRVNFAEGYGNKSLPFYKRYFEGGSSSVRGFDFNSLGSKYLNGKPKGGELSFVSSIGLSSSLNFLGIDNPNMRGIIFSDAGAISEKLNDFELDDIRSSVGVQFSWLTPIGPLGFNLAKPLIKKSGDSTETFSFELGAKF